MRSLRWTRVSIRCKGELWKQRTTQRLPHEDGGLSGVSTSQGMPKTASNPQEVRKGQGRISS